MTTLPATFRFSDAVDDAFESIGFDPEGLTGKHIASARRSVRLMLAAWNNDSVDFWKVVSAVQVPTTVNMQTFTPDPTVGVIDFLRMSVLRDTYTTPMIQCSASDWFAIPDKDTVVGMPNRWWAQRLQNSITGWIYPKAENDTDIILYDAMVRSYDSSYLGAHPDVPPLWEQAFTAGMAFYLATKFNSARIEEKRLLYVGPEVRRSGDPLGSYGTARMGNRERADTIMVVHKSRRPRR